MLWLIPIVGSLLIMMGQHDRSEALFYYFRLEDQVPESSRATKPSAQRGSWHPWSAKRTRSRWTRMNEESGTPA